RANSKRVGMTRSYDRGDESDLEAGQPSGSRGAEGLSPKMPGAYPEEPKARIDERNIEYIEKITGASLRPATDDEALSVKRQRRMEAFDRRKNEPSRDGESINSGEKARNPVSRQVVPRDSSALLMPEQRAAAAAKSAAEKHEEFIKAAMAFHTTVAEAVADGTMPSVKLVNTAFFNSINRLKEMKPADIGYDAVHKEATAHAKSLHDMVVGVGRDMREKEQLKLQKQLAIDTFSQSNWVKAGVAAAIFYSVFTAVNYALGSVVDVESLKGKS
ncbi:MAG: hypothetical protein ABWY00_05690, partial [Dongiaceae bacterium]